MVKRANQRYDTITKIKDLFNIQSECKTEEDIVENIGIGNKELELISIKLFVDKVVTNKYFKVSIDNYKLCKKEAEKLFN
jgi:hypothetical protein